MAKQTLTTIKDEHFGIARKIVSNMTTESWETIPHCAATYDAEVTKFMQVLKEINSTIPKEEKITVNTAMMRVIVEAIKACPEINSHIYFNRKLVRGEVKTFKEINISMPTVLHNGEMMTLNIHNMEKKTLSEMRDTIKETIRRANNTDLNEVMYEVSLDNTLTGLKHGKIAQTVCQDGGRAEGDRQSGAGSVDLKGNHERARRKESAGGRCAGHCRLQSRRARIGWCTVRHRGVGRDLRAGRYTDEGIRRWRIPQRKRCVQGTCPWCGWRADRSSDLSCGDR